MKKVLFTKDRPEKEIPLDRSVFDAFDDLTIYESADRDTQLKAAREAEIILAEGVRLDKELLEGAKNLKYIIVLATGYNRVDMDYCEERGIRVSNIPTYGTDIVARFTFALLLEACHRAGLHNDYVRNGGWTNQDEVLHWQTEQILLNGKTLGIIGYGRIGKAVGKIAEAFGMKLLTAGRSEEEKKEVYEKADIITLHCNLTEENREMIDKKAIKQMKDGVILINAARGGLVDEEALYDALRTGKIKAAAFDVAEKEPRGKDHPLLALDNFIQTPHMAWGAPEARQRILKQGAETLRAYLEGEPIHLVN